MTRQNRQHDGECANCRENEPKPYNRSVQVALRETSCGGPNYRAMKVRVLDPEECKRNGKIDQADHAPDEDPAIAARRELVEETGYGTDAALVRLTVGATSAGRTSETVIFYQARNVRKVESGGGGGGEEITVHVVPLDGIREWLRSRESATTLVDPKVYAGLWLVLGHRR